MNKRIKAVYEKGIIRPLEPLALPEGSRLGVIIVTHEQRKTGRNAAKVLAQIAAQPLEGPSSAFSGRDHDSILYPSK